MLVASKKLIACVICTLLVGCVNHSKFSSLEPVNAYSSRAAAELNPMVVTANIEQPNPGFYLVRPGDTLYSIAFRFGLDYKKLAAANNVDSNYRIFVGQSLALKEVELKNNVAGASQSRPSSQSSQITSIPVTNLNSQNSGATESVAKPSVIASSSWLWPHNGNIVRTYAEGVSSRKGIDIQGRIGDSVTAAATGVVVYAGNGLPGYGNLIILEHANSLMSAYAFNDAILVKEKDQVKAGDKIATMGKQGDQPGLHFEIRRDGKPVNPELYLPKR